MLLFHPLQMPQDFEPECLFFLFSLLAGHRREQRQVMGSADEAIGRSYRYQVLQERV